MFPARLTFKKNAHAQSKRKAETQVKSHFVSFFAFCHRNKSLSLNTTKILFVNFGKICSFSVRYCTTFMLIWISQFCFLNTLLGLYVAKMFLNFYWVSQSYPILFIIEPTNSTIPKMYRKVEIKYSKYGIKHTF